MQCLIFCFDTVETEYGTFIKASLDNTNLSAMARTEDKALKLLLIKLADTIQENIESEPAE